MRLDTTDVVLSRFCAASLRSELFGLGNENLHALGRQQRGHGAPLDAPFETTSEDCVIALLGVHFKACCL